MQDIAEQPTMTSGAAAKLAEAAVRAAKWADEPFLRPDEDPAVVLAPGTARRRALDEAIAEIEAGQQGAVATTGASASGSCSGSSASSTEQPPHLASGTELRRHQIDALAGMLTELIAANQAAAENGNGRTATAPSSTRPSSTRTKRTSRGGRGRGATRRRRSREDPGAARRFRFRHPTASGKTIAAAGFVEAARTLGVLILTHRRLLVSQFTGDLTTEGYGKRFTEAVLKGAAAATARPDHDPDVRLVRAPRRRPRPRRVPARHLRRGAHGARREDERRDPLVPGAASTSG